MIYKKTVEETLYELKTHHTLGLSAAEAEARLKEYGKNALNEQKSTSIFKLFVEAFKDPMIIILLIAAAIQVVMGETVDSILIFAIVILSAALGVIQAKKAESSLESLKKISVPDAKVIRDGEKLTIPAPEVVPGDLVSLEAGDFVPADGRIIECESLSIVEGMLTGESEPVEKSTEKISEDVGLGDRINMGFSSSMIVNGRGKMVVTETAMNTEIGKIASMIQNAQAGQTPLQIKIESFTKKLGVVIIILSAVIFAIQIIRSYMNTSTLETQVILDSFMFAVAIAVAAIPEALSSIVTIVLSMGTKKMVEKNAIIRRLPAVETLGSTSVICTDKTGTLTQNKMTVVDYYTIDNRDNTDKEIDTELKQLSLSLDDSQLEHIAKGELEGLNQEVRMLLISILCNDSSITPEGDEVGDPTEVAFLNLAKASGLDFRKARELNARISELPFDSDRKLMSTLHSLDGENIVLTKGAPDVLVSRSNRILLGDKVVELDDELREALRDENEKLSENALRVLAFGYKSTQANTLKLEDEDGLIFVGYFAMIDPPRESVINAIEEARGAGIRTVMITGDHKVTATAIAKDIGLYREGDMAKSGTELDSMSDEELYENIEKISIYARVSPENKIRIVDTWQKKGFVTAMTGDGVNDAPALKKADIGIAMGSGTEVAKDASAMVLVDDNFTSIVNAVEVGRTVYSNIKKSIAYQFSGNLGAIITIVASVVMNWANPFTALQLLFINMVNDSLPAISLGFEKSEKGVMKHKPRPKDEGLMQGGSLPAIAKRGILIAIVTIIAQYIGLSHSPQMGVAMAFSTLLLSRTLQTFSARSNESTIFELGFLSNKMVLLAVVVCLTLYGVISIPGIREIFSIPEAFTLTSFGICLGLSLAAVFVMEIAKIFVRKGKEA